MHATSLITRRGFLKQLESDLNLSADNVGVLEASGARTPEAIMSLLENFPELTNRGLLHAASLSNEVMRRGGPALQNMYRARAGRRGPPPSHRPPGGGYGALPPPGALWQRNDTVPWSPGSASVGGTATLAAAVTGTGTIDVRRCLPWPVRDQGQRATCVAFATTALREHLLCQMGGSIDDQSEQFLYWDIKTNSPDPDKLIDGTWIEFAFSSLQNAGICSEHTWPYNMVFDPTNIAQGGPNLPSATARSTALSLRCTAAVHERVSTGSGNAQLVLDALTTNHRPVAIALPVFADPSVPQGNNWETSVGVSYGLVLDPPPTSFVDGGHCVCVTGFAPDPLEPLGGYFIIRNSWNSTWGAQLPAANYFGPEPGYGQVSASYVDRYLWEYGQL